MRLRRTTSWAAATLQEFTKRNAHTPLGKKPLPAPEKRPKVHVVFQEHHDVVSADDEEVRLLAARDRVLGVPAYTVDGQEHASSELGLTGDFFTKHVEVSRRAGVLLPLGLQQVYFVVEFEGTVNLLADNAKGFPRCEIMEGEELIHYLLKLEPSLLPVLAFVEPQELPLECLQVDAPLGPLAFAKCFAARSC